MPFGFSTMGYKSQLLLFFNTVYYIPLMGSGYVVLENSTALLITNRSSEFTSSLVSAAEVVPPVDFFSAEVEDFDDLVSAAVIVPVEAVDADEFDLALYVRVNDLVSEGFDL